MHSDLLNLIILSFSPSIVHLYPLSFFLLSIARNDYLITPYRKATNLPLIYFQQYQNTDTQEYIFLLIHTGKIMETI